MTLDDESVTYAELRQNLKKCNFSDVEIEMFMSQYDTNENEQIDEDEAIKVFKDLAQGSIDSVHATMYTGGWNVWGEWFLAGN